jgi:hypothetical protein
VRLEEAGQVTGLRFMTILSSRVRLKARSCSCRAQTGALPGAMRTGRVTAGTPRAVPAKARTPCVDVEDLAIVSFTRGFAPLRAGTPTVINSCPRTQDPDEKAQWLIWHMCVRFG